MTDNIQLVILENITLPFSIGIFRKSIVLPSYILQEQNTEKLEHIFMHELVHFNKMDIPLALLSTILQILHWFTPIIWMAFFKMRADRELDSAISQY